jgi:hypothetical protein
VDAELPEAAQSLRDELWGADRPETAAKALQGYVSQLRKTLGPEMLVTGPGGYMLRLAPGQLDADRFEQLVDDARDAEPHDSAEWLREALALWRGPPLADFTYDDFAQGEIARFEERRLVALERRIEADLALGRHQEVAGELASLVKQHPLRERLRAELMLALYRSGRQRRHSRRTPMPGARSSTSSGWGRARSCGNCRLPSSRTIRSSDRRREPGPAGLPLLAAVEQARSIVVLKVSAVTGRSRRGLARRRSPRCLPMALENRGVLVQDSQSSS